MAHRQRPLTIAEEIDSGVAELVPDPDRVRSWTLVVNGTPQSHVDLDDPAYLDFEYVRRLGHLADLVFCSRLGWLQGAWWEHRRPGSPAGASPPMVGWPAGASREYGRTWQMVRECGRPGGREYSRIPRRGTPRNQWRQSWARHRNQFSRNVIMSIIGSWISAREGCPRGAVQAVVAWRLSTVAARAAAARAPV